MPGCPSTEELRLLEGGELDDDRAEELFDHLESCIVCQRGVESIRTGSLDGRILRRAIGDSGTVASGFRDREKDNSFKAWDIPDYERVCLCGEGAFGTVWAVRDRVGVHRALKVIDLGRLNKADVKCRELTALEAYCRLVESHPNLINVSHVGIHGEKLYYTMELADDDRSRKTVRDGIPEKYRPLTMQQAVSGHSISVNTAVEIVLRLLRGLSNLHDAGLAHRDIKPANIVFVDCEPKLSDIGMITTNTATPSQVGTPEYMPPDGRMDYTADTYAMGRILYELVVDDVGTRFPELPENLMVNFGQWDLEKLSEFFEKACASEGEKRFSHAWDMHEALEACRSWSYDSLFDDLAKDEKVPSPQRDNRYTPIIVAVINAIPWILGLLLAFYFVRAYV